jgi:hypothetical protein
MSRFLGWAKVQQEDGTAKRKLVYCQLLAYLQQYMVQKDDKTQYQWAFWLKWGMPVLLIFAIEWMSSSPMWIEKNYSNGTYIMISRVLRTITGWLGFSIGDIFYVVVTILVLWKLGKLFIALFRTKWSWLHFGKRCLKLIYLLIWIYIGFNFLWGLNYDRAGIQYQLQLPKQQYCKEDVVELTNKIIDKVNACRRQIKDTLIQQKSFDEIFREADNDYQIVSAQFNFLRYKNHSIKNSLFSSFGNYFGFTGYYNPFSGEAQVRSDILRILIPYITCHEMAHQLGYASESEANFVGYLAASSSSDIYFQYSVYLDLFSYAQSEEIKQYFLDRDTKGLKDVLLQNRNNLDSLVKKDRKEIRDFFFKRENSISPIVSSAYDQYLKMNKQSAGIDSYNEVIGWLLAYQRKYGKL